MPRPHQPSVWTLQDAKAHLSDVVRRARSDGPQRVTVHGKEAAVILSPDAYRRLSGGQTGEALLAAFQACPYPEVDFEPESVRSPVRDVAL
jgi:prevent-host-death family protein